LLERCYPLGTLAFHILGESLNRTNWSARNSSFVERDSNIVLQGFNDDPHSLVVTLPDGRSQTVVARDYRELLPLVRQRGDLSHRALRLFMARQRDVSLTIDGPLQALVAQALEAQVRSVKAERGAVVVIDAATGALLAGASYPRPDLDASDSAAPQDPAVWLDRARVTACIRRARRSRSSRPPPRSRPGCTRRTRTSCASDCPTAASGPVLPRYGTIRDDITDKNAHGKLNLSGGAGRLL
jgi:hypothetical protein